MAKTIKVLDLLVLVGASEDSLNEGLPIWKFPALALANTNSINKSLHSWEGLLSGNMTMLLVDVKEILQVGKVGMPKSWLHACTQIEHWTVVMAMLLGARSHKAITWLLSLAHVAQAKALVFKCQALTNSQLPLAVLAHIPLTFHAFFASI
jgi:hypothetical protein